MMGAVVRSWGFSLPKQQLHNAELAARVGVTEEWIYERTGIKSRRIASAGESTASLAISAGTDALERAELRPDQIDLVIVATATADQQLPGAAPLVQAGIGATRAGAFDVGAGCAGFLYALSVASALVGAGTIRRVLVCGADVLSRVTDYSDARSCILFGDGAGAAVVEATEGSGQVGPFLLHSDGTATGLLHIDHETGLIRMEGRQVYRRAVQGMTESVREIVAAAGISLDDVRLLVAHQANARILEAVASQLGLDERRVLTNIVRYGNTSAASIPIAIAEAAQQNILEDGDIVVLTAFGAGFVWGAGMLRWSTRSQDQERALVSEAVGV
ncbi:MAG: ketoacyl-ACP synthase III [Actinomycetota bacterium]|nr:ketoacyl-ACP synthase III [Actinomycetota bacterium]